MKAFVEITKLFLRILSVLLDNIYKCDSWDWSIWM